MDKTVLIATKDIGDFNVYLPVARLLASSGIKVVIVAEGLSMDAWIKNGFEIYGGKPAEVEGKYDKNTLVRHDFNLGSVLDDIEPNLVMVGLPSPNHLPGYLAEVAVPRGIKVGAVEDLWGTHGRMDTIPDFICTLDTFGEQMIRKNPNRTPKIHVTGSPAMDNLKQLTARPPTTGFLDVLLGTECIGNPKVVLAAGQNESTTPMIAGLVEALDAQNEPYILIPRFHPKWMRDETKADHRACWEASLRKAKNGVVIHVPAALASTEQLILYVHEVVSIYSTTLLQTALLGRKAISWISPVGRTCMRQELSGLERYPLVTLGAALEVSTPDEYSAARNVPVHQLGEAAMKLPSADGKSAARVAEVIKSYLS